MKSSVTHFKGQIDVEYKDDKTITIVMKKPIYIFVSDVTIYKKVKTVRNLSHILHPLSSSVTNNSICTTMRNKRLFIYSQQLGLFQCNVL